MKIGSENSRQPEGFALHTFVFPWQTFLMKKINYKIILSVTAVMLTSVSRAETYQCAYLFEDQPYSNTFKRMSNNTFSERSLAGNQEIDVLFENTTYLSLGALKSYGDFIAYNVAVINKVDLTWRATAIVDPSDKANLSAIVEGTCMLDE